MDTSTNSPSSWVWSFGDGGVSTSPNPVYTYTTRGAYTVTLTATNSAGSNTTSLTNYITANQVTVTPTALFKSTVTSGYEPLTVQFVDASIDLSQDRSLPTQFAIVAVDRIKFGDEALRHRLHDGVNQFSRFGKAKAAAWNQFAQHIHYQQGDFKKLPTYTTLGKQCAKLEKEWGTKAHRIFYMATPPSMFGEIPKYLGKAGLARDRKWARIVIEKPIGYDLESARSLERRSRRQLRGIPNLSD